MSAGCSTARRQKSGVRTQSDQESPWRSINSLVTHQSNMAKRFMAGLHTVTGLASNLLARRPFFLFWFMAQISRYVNLVFPPTPEHHNDASRSALSLWDCDHSLTLALDLCRALLAPIEYLTALWPCSGEQIKFRPVSQLTRLCSRTKKAI